MYKQGRNVSEKLVACDPPTDVVDAEGEDETTDEYDSDDKAVFEGVLRHDIAIANSRHGDYNEVKGVEIFDVPFF